MLTESQAVLGLKNSIGSTNMWLNVGHLLVETGNSFLKRIIFFLREVIAHSGAGPPHYPGFKVTVKHTALGRTTLDK